MTSIGAMSDSSTPKRRRKFITRLIRKDGTVIAYGRRFATKEGAERFAGDRPIFGVYFGYGDQAGEAVGLALWGHPDDEWPGRYCEDGTFKWDSWNEVEHGL